MQTFTCHQCKQTLPQATAGGTGYGYDRQHNKICYACCGEMDRAQMVATGKAVLYLADGRMTNWPNTLSMPILRSRSGRHNIAGIRVDVWFRGPDGMPWHGVNYGHHSQLTHCKRVKH